VTQEDFAETSARYDHFDAAGKSVGKPESAG
jgi:hypothetical protein